jgi:hypothetical protein
MRPSGRLDLKAILTICAKQELGSVIWCSVCSSNSDSELGAFALQVR